MKIQPIKTRIFKASEPLLPFIENYLPTALEKTVLVVTSKIVALAQGRVAKKINKNTKAEIVKRESDLLLPTKHVYLTIKDNMIMADAGVDESNANGQIIMLPKDSFRVAASIGNYFKKKFKLKNFGVIITDSRCAPMRAGIIGAALGYAGFKGLKDYRKNSDIFGRLFKYTAVNVADSLAAAAVLLMGEGNERQPLAIISQAPVKYAEKINKNELKIDIKEDMFGPMLKNLK